MRPTLQACWLLHARPYRETSLMADLLSADEGRVRAVIRGGRGDGRRARQWRGLAQPFVPLLAAWAGRHELKTVHQLEPAGGLDCVLRGRALYCGLYVNELLLRLLQPGDAQPRVLAGYARLLAALAASPPEGLEPLLRAFELDLLQALGLCPDLGRDAFTQAPLAADRDYRYLPETGFVPASAAGTALTVSGRVLLALAARDFSDAALLPAAKRLNRALLQPLLGERPLASRRLFAAHSVAASPD